MFATIYSLEIHIKRLTLQRPPKRGLEYLSLLPNGRVRYKGVSSELLPTRRSDSNRNTYTMITFSTTELTKKDLRKLPRDGSYGQGPNGDNLNINNIWVPGMRFCQLRTQNMKTVLGILFFLWPRDRCCSQTFFY